MSLATATQEGSLQEPLAQALSLLRRRFGAAVVRWGDDPLPGAAWPTGMPALDTLTGIGGLPCGRLSVLAGQGHGATGRLTLLQALAAVASRSMQVAYVDLAGTLDPGFLADLGADLDACLVLRPRAGAIGPGLAMARALVRAGVPWLAVALGRRRRHGGAAAGLEHALPALGAAVEGTRAVACLAAPSPLPPVLAYGASLTVACAALGWQEAHGDVVGLRVRLTVVKSKLSAPGAEASLLLRYPRPQAAAEVVGLPALVDDRTAAPVGAAVGEKPVEAPPISATAAAG